MANFLGDMKFHILTATVWIVFTGHTLHAATPLRELSTDRPDTTESAYTVDKGCYQWEMELASFTRDGGEWTEYSLAEWNLKYGLTDCADLQLVLPVYTHVRGGDEGYGDTVLRLKYNLWGNDSGDTAMALMPFVKIPTAGGALGNDAFEGGLMLPFAFTMPGDWSCAVMAEFDLTYDDGESDYQPVGLLSATGSHAITETTAGFLEIVGIFSTESSDDTEAYFNTGFTWALADHWQVDGGIRVGLTSSSTDLTPFLGFSHKF